jgi:hypothetical protein
MEVDQEDGYKISAGNKNAIPGGFNQSIVSLKSWNYGRRQNLSDSAKDLEN